MKNLANLLQQAIDFNHKAGNKLHTYNTLEFWRAVENQCSYMVEESQEGFEAAEINDAVETIDALADELFVLAWKIEQLEKAGFDVEGALQAVVDNNMKKVFNSFYEACSAKEYLEMTHDEEFFVETSVFNGIPFYTVRRFRDNKIMKPVNHPKVDLSEFIP